MLSNQTFTRAASVSMGASQQIFPTGAVSVPEGVLDSTLTVGAVSVPEGAVDNTHSNGAVSVSEGVSPMHTSTAVAVPPILTDSLAVSATAAPQPLTASDTTQAPSQAKAHSQYKIYHGSTEFRNGNIYIYIYIYIPPLLQMSPIRHRRQQRRPQRMTGPSIMSSLPFQTYPYYIQKLQFRVS
jgi:hypothetical protein